MRKKLPALRDVSDYFWVAPIADAKAALKDGAHALRMRQPADTKPAKGLADRKSKDKPKAAPEQA